MKKTTNSNSTRKKLLPAFAMLTVSAVALTSATYAWFTMNKTVTVEGMTVKTKVGSNLLIAPDSYTLATTTDNRDSNYTSSIVQSRICLLEPSSTNNGVDYWYTVEASADGNKLGDASWVAYNENTSVTNSVAGKEKYDKNFNIAYTTGTADNFTTSNITMDSSASRDGAAYGYVDYVFYIKATADSTSDTLIMTKCNLLHNNAVVGMSDESTPAAISDKAWRVAVLSQAASAETDLDTALTAGDLVTILAPNGALYQTADEGVTGANATAALVKKGVAQGTPDTAVNKAVIASDLTAGSSSYYKITVRLWLEGEDTTCTSDTYAKLTANYTLDLEFKLEANDTNAVYKIGSVERDASGSYVVTKTGETTTTTKGGATATIPSTGYTYKIGGVSKTYAEVTSAISALTSGQSITVVVEPAS